MHASAPAGRSVPAGQATHPMPSAPVSVCGGQSTQTPSSRRRATRQPHDSPASLTSPGGQAVHAAEPAGRSVPRRARRAANLRCVRHLMVRARPARAVLNVRPCAAPRRQHRDRKRRQRRPTAGVRRSDLDRITPRRRVMGGAIPISRRATADGPDAQAVSPSQSGKPVPRRGQARRQPHRLDTAVRPNVRVQGLHDQHRPRARANGEFAARRVRQQNRRPVRRRRHRRGSGFRSRRHRCLRQRPGRHNQPTKRARSPKPDGPSHPHGSTP